MNINGNLIVATLILSSFTPLASADENSICAANGMLAETIMRGRQAGKPISEVLTIVQDNTYEKAMTMMAYEEPAWSTFESKERAEREFRIKIELDCYKNFQR